MKIIRTLLLWLCLCACALGAAGDLVSVTVLADGWEADIKLSGLATGGTYSTRLGLGTNNDPATGTPAITFAVTSEGYNNAGTLGTIARTVYGTKEVRWPYSTASITGTFTSGTFVDGETVTQAVTGATAIILGAQSAGTKLYVRTVTGAPSNVNMWSGATATFTATVVPATLTSGAPREVYDGTNTTVRVALSDYIYLDDNTGAGKSGTAPTVTILSGFYTSAGTPNAASGAGYAVTQNSTAVYPKVVANWSRPGYQRVTADFSLGAVAFHSSGMNGNPVAAVKFTVTDTSAHTVTATVAAPTIDSTQGDAVPVVEYIGTIAVSTLTALNVLTCNFIAYPWIGDAASILDTSTGTAQPTQLFGPITMLNDKSSTFGVTVALVDSTSGSNTTGTAYDIGSYVEGTALPFLTISKALSAIAAYNNTNRTRNDPGAGIVYLKDGNHTWVGAGATTAGNVPTTWATVTRAASSAGRSSCVINAGSNTTDIVKKIKLYDVKVTSTSALTFYNLSSLWVDQCELSATNGSLIYFIPAYYVTRSLCAGTQGFYPFSGADTGRPAIIRGNTLTGLNKSIFCWTVLGNSKTDAPTTPQILFRLVGANSDSATNSICAYNIVTKWSGNVVYSDSAVFIATNTAIVQNLFETTAQSPGTYPVLQIAAQTGTSGTIDNVILWNNTFVGERVNCGYNADGTTSYSRNFWSVKNNITENFPTKQDTYAGFSGASGARIGAFSFIYGVFHSGNYNAESVSDAGSFMHEFPGLKAYAPAGSGQPPSGTANAVTITAFTNRQAGTITGIGTGGGTYTLTAASPAVTLQRDWLLPYDLAGTARTPVDAAGAYHYGVSSGFFFSQ